MLTEEAKNRYLYRKEADAATVSVFPSVAVAPDEVSFYVASPAETVSGVCCSVRDNGNSQYFWSDPCSKYFSAIFITITAAVKAEFRKVKRFARRMADRIKISLTLRKTVCLRL